MKMHLINPFFRYAISFRHRPVGYTVMPADNHLVYVKSGSVSIKFGKKVFHLKKDDILYSPKGVPYEFFTAPADADTSVLISVNFDLTHDDCLDTAPRTPRRYMGNGKTETEKQLDSISDDETFLAAPYAFKHAKQYYSFFSKIINEFHGTNEYARDLCSCAVKELIIRLHTFNGSVNDSESDAVAVVTEYISKNYEKKLENKFLAELVGYHPNYLGSLFKRTFKCGIQQYILNIRIGEAKRLIGESELPMTEVSSLCGFENYPYFSAYFKKRVGINPSQYRIRSKTIV